MPVQQGCVVLLVWSAFFPLQFELELFQISYPGADIINIAKTAVILDASPALILNDSSSTFSPDSISSAAAACCAGGPHAAGIGTLNAGHSLSTTCALPNHISLLSFLVV